MTDNYEPKIAESARFWRLNSLMALRDTRESEREAQDPDHLKAIKANNAEFAGLQARENAVKSRYNRIKSKEANQL